MKHPQFYRVKNLKIVKCERLEDVYNDAIVCDKTIYPEQKVWTFKKSRGEGPLIPNPGSKKVELPHLTKMTYIGFYAIFYP